MKYKDGILILANNSSGLYDFRGYLISELLKRKKVTVSVPKDDKVEELNQLGVKLIETKVDRRGMNPIKDFKLFIKYLQILASEYPELVITYTIKPNIYGGLACRIFRLPYATNITGLGTAFQKQGLFRKLIVFLYRTALRNAKVVFFENAENMQIFINEKIVTKEKCCLLNGAGVDLIKFSPMDYPTENEIISFLFMGRVMREKGVEELFEACRRIYREGYSIRLDVLGNCEEDYTKVLTEYENEGWLVYHGYQSDVRPFIQNAHCFVLPSWHEGMANTNLECAAMGRPLITSNIYGCKEAVVENVSGYLCEKMNTDSLYEKMKKFTQLSNAERKAMGVAGRKHMEAVFDKKKVVEWTIERL